MFFLIKQAVPFFILSCHLHERLLIWDVTVFMGVAALMKGCKGLSSGLLQNVSPTLAAPLGCAEAVKRRYAN